MDRRDPDGDRTELVALQRLVTDNLLACERIAGGRSALATALGVAPETLRLWSHKVPVDKQSQTPGKLDTWVATYLDAHPKRSELTSLTGTGSFEALVESMRRLSETRDQASREASSESSEVVTAEQGEPDTSTMSDREVSVVETTTTVGSVGDSQTDPGGAVGQEPPCLPLGQLASEPPTGTERPGSTWRSVVAAVVVIAVAVVVVLILRPGDPDPSGTPSVEAPSAPETGRAPTAVPVAARVQLDDSNFCSWQLGSRPIPLVSLDPVRMRIDARCNDPANPDPEEDPGATLYSDPSNDEASDAVGRLANGADFVPVCFTRGDGVSDASEPANSSAIWVLVGERDGFVPNVNIGGGYTVRQLEAVGLTTCP